MVRSTDASFAWLLLLLLQPRRQAGALVASFPGMVPPTATTSMTRAAASRATAAGGAVALVVDRRFSAAACARTPSSLRGAVPAAADDDGGAIAVPAARLDRGLSAAERTVVDVVRRCGPSVAYVTSVWPLAADHDDDDEGDARSGGGTTTRRGQRSRRQRAPHSPSGGGNLPRGQNLGSGSGFVVQASGGGCGNAGGSYLVTNYHVIAQAHRVQTTVRRYDEFCSHLAGNLTAWTDGLRPNRSGSGSGSGDIVNALVDATLRRGVPTSATALPAVYVRLDSATKYQKCRIVNVKPELDLAVLQILNSSTNTTTTAAAAGLAFGRSSDLLVGQSLVAIGNPFGLDTSVTTGVVSALQRDIRTAAFDRGGSPAAGPIRGGIQTDCAINPGNSGGPLLNLRGLVVGVNTAIVTTSGSNAGVGFAVAADQVQPAVDQMIRLDRDHPAPRPRAWLGVAILKTGAPAAAPAKNWVASVAPLSPAARAGVTALRVDADTGAGGAGVVRYGDAIVAVAGNAVASYAALRAELDTRAVGEQLALTLERRRGNAGGGEGGEQRRVVYLTLEARPP